MDFGRGSLARRQDFQGVGAGCLAMPAAVTIGRPHGFPASAVSACRSLCNPERMRVLTVPSGWLQPRRGFGMRQPGEECRFDRSNTFSVQVR